MKNENKSSNWFTGALQLTFIILKLCGIISWSWWWVMSPLLISTGILIFSLLALCIVKHKKK